MLLIAPAQTAGPQASRLPRVHSTPKLPRFMHPSSPHPPINRTSAVLLYSYCMRQAVNGLGLKTNLKSQLKYEFAVNTILPHNSPVAAELLVSSIFGAI